LALSPAANRHCDEGSPSPHALGLSRERAPPQPTGRVVLWETIKREDLPSQEGKQEEEVATHLYNVGLLVERIATAKAHTLSHSLFSLLSSVPTVPQVRNLRWYQRVLTQGG